MGYSEKVFSRQYPVVVFFVQHLAYYKGLWALYNGITDHKDFWRSTCDAHLKLATVAWCNVFGSSREDLHWTKTPTDNTRAIDNFRGTVLSETGFTTDQWEAYHKEMLGFRNKFVAHLDVHSPFNDPVPHFDPALQVAYAYQEWVRDLIRPVLLNQPTLRSQYELCEVEAGSIVSRPPRP